MNADVANLQRERGCSVFVSPAEFVLHRQSVAVSAANERVGAPAGVLVHFTRVKRTIDSSACWRNIEIEAENLVSMQFPAMVEKQDAGEDQSTRDDAAPRAAEQVSIERASESDRIAYAGPAGLDERPIDLGGCALLGRNLERLARTPEVESHEYCMIRLKSRRTVLPVFVFPAVCLSCRVDGKYFAHDRLENITLHQLREFDKLLPTVLSTIRNASFTFESSVDSELVAMVITRPGGAPREAPSRASAGHDAAFLGGTARCLEWVSSPP
jgi:hypothetical protein